MFEYLKRFFGSGDLPTIIDERCLNEDWAAGDLAECIVDDFTPPLPVPMPVRGELLRVTSIEEGCITGTSRLIVALNFRGFSCSFDCRAFRKIRPEIEPASEEFREDLRKRLTQSEPVQ